MSTLELEHSLTMHQSFVFDVCWHPNGTDVMCCEYNRITIWGWEGFHMPKFGRKMIIEKASDAPERFEKIALSPCGNYIISESTDGSITVWDKKSTQLVCKMTSQGHKNKVNSVSSISDHILHATPQKDSILVWKLKGDEYKCTVITAHTKSVRQVRWHPREEILASASYDNTVKIFKEDAADSDWSCIATLSHMFEVRGLSWDMIGNRIATCSGYSTDKRVKIWRNMGVATSNNEPIWKCVCTLPSLPIYIKESFCDIDWCKTTGLLVTACGSHIMIFKQDSGCDPHQPNFTMVCSINSAHADAISCFQWNPTIPGQLATASYDRSVKIWLYNEVTMSQTAENKGMLKDIVSAMSMFADTLLAGDNVGLLVEPTEPKFVSHVLLTNDLTEDVIDEAIRLKTDLIVTYHPLIFALLKSLTTASWEGRIVGRCFENNIAVLSHSSFDVVKGGVNDWLAEAFELQSSKPIKRNENDATHGFGRLCTLKSRISIDEAVKLVKQRTNLKHVKLTRARGTDGYINTVALCAGSGLSVLKGISADLYVTGKMLNRDVLVAANQGIHVILTNHSDSERGFLKIIAFILKHTLQTPVEVCVSESDPLQIV